MEESTKAKEQRRLKIKELEASLFGAGNDWMRKTVELPELKNVNEYATKGNFHTFTYLKIASFYLKKPILHFMKIWLLLCRKKAQFYFISVSTQMAFEK